jgi:hypothetical protein
VVFDSCKQYPAYPYFAGSVVAVTGEACALHIIAIGRLRTDPRTNVFSVSSGPSIRVI